MSIESTGDCRVMGLHQVSSQHAVVPLNKENLDQTLNKRIKILSPYLAVIARAKESTTSPAERQLFDVIYGLLEITEISKLRAAEMVEEWDRTEKPKVLARMKGQP
jgi:hypothetical protein